MSDRYWRWNSQTLPITLKTHIHALYTPFQLLLAVSTQTANSPAAAPLNPDSWTLGTAQWQDPLLGLEEGESVKRLVTLLFPSALVASLSLYLKTLRSERSECLVSLASLWQKRAWKFNNQTFCILYLSPLVISFYFPVILTFMLNVKAGAWAHCPVKGKHIKKKKQEEQKNVLRAKFRNLNWTSKWVLPMMVGW